tara:strand:+ start:2084 stop:2581 length:498 start_codon:yes stop_codon:yes gene_type:complete
MVRKSAPKKPVSWVIGVAAVSVATGCASFSNAPTKNAELCEALDVWVESVPDDESAVLAFGRSGQWLVNHIKWCKMEPVLETQDEVCRILLEETSTEFFDANFRFALVCFGMNLETSQSAGSLSLKQIAALVYSDHADEYLEIELNPEDLRDGETQAVRFNLERY